jgi:hypothetical protein
VIPARPCRGIATETVSGTLWKALLGSDSAALRAAPLYGDLLDAALAAPGAFLFGRLAQSLDGRIATDSGRSF